MAKPTALCLNTRHALYLISLLLVASFARVHAASELLVGYTPGKADQVAAAVAAQGCTVLQHLKLASTLVVACGQQGSGPDTDVAAAAAAQSAKQQLAGVPNVQHVAFNTPIRAPPVLVEESVVTASALDASGSCSYQPDLKNPDWMLGRDSEGTPYGVKMAQAAEEEVVALSRQFRQNVFYCVLDSGLDISNIDIPSDASGCMPGPRPGQASSISDRICWPFSNDAFGHGTPVTGVLGALRNGRGVVGAAAEGASLYQVKVLDENGEGCGRRELDGLTDCFNEHEDRKAANPGLKMVVSMSYGGKYYVNATQAIMQAAAARGDVMFVAAAGNENSNDTIYPAGYKEVISVGAVDWNMGVASFSNHNKDVELVAAGMAVLSTYPLKLSAGLKYYLQDFEAVVTQPPLPSAQADPTLFREPAARIPTGSSTTDVTAELVDCGLGQTTCQNAQGKICLIERGGATATWPALFCLKTVNCLQGGGVGVLLYNNDANECAPFSATTLKDERCPKVTWPTVIMVSRRQGLALKDALSSLPPPTITTDNSTSNSTDNTTNTEVGTNTSGLTVTLRVPPAQTELALTTISGTSFAAPLVSGVAGTVWAAHSNCSAREIRAALRNSALKPLAMSGAHSNPFYGFGVVQALAAHKYLQANLCEADKPKPEVQVTVTPLNPTEGGQVTVRVMVTDTRPGSDKKGIGFRNVRLAVTPPSSMTCDALVIRTGRLGVATTKCTLISAGQAAVSAQMVSSKLWQAASSTQDLTVAKRI